MKIFGKDDKREYEKSSGSKKLSDFGAEIMNRLRIRKGDGEEKKQSPDYDDIDYVPSTVEDDTYLNLGNYPEAYEEIERRPDKGGQYMADDELKGYIDKWTIHGGEDRKYDDIYQTVAGMRINFKVSSPKEDPVNLESEPEKPAGDNSGFYERLRQEENKEEFEADSEYEEVPKYESEEWRAQYSNSSSKERKHLPGIDKAIRFTQRIGQATKLSKSQERRKKRRRRRRRIKKSILAGIIIVLLLFGAVVCLMEADKRGCFNIDTVRIEGLNHYTEYDIIKVSGVETGVSLLSLNTDPIRKKIEELPYVERAVISRDMPKTLVLSVTERMPFYAIYYGGAYTLVDEGFTALERTNDSGDYPILEGFVPVSAPEPGKPFEAKDETTFKIAMEMVECLKSAGLTFYKINYKSGLMNIYITKSIVIEGTYQNISNYIREINEILYSQTVQGIERGTLHVGENGYISFSPMI